MLGHFGLGSWGMGRLVYLSEGSATDVCFDSDSVFQRQVNRGDVVGFLHTHPNTDAQPSATDHATMGAWQVSLGKSLICAIDGQDVTTAQHRKFVREEVYRGCLALKLQRFRRGDGNSQSARQPGKRSKRQLMKQSP